jgi:threonylcarbamoyladenosine tRNA methylthiotransferase MtaB
MNASNIKISVTTLGCKVNQCDSAAMEESLRNCGYEVVLPSKKSDVYIVNTCVVTKKTESQSRQLLRKYLRSSPDCQVIAVGCYAQKSVEDLKAVSKRVSVFGNSEKKDIGKYVKALLNNGQAKQQVSDILLEKTFTTPASPIFLDRTRAFLKVQDGCNSGCSYCIVPSVRGKSRSLPKDEFISRLHAFADQGFLEVVLTGIHLGAYGLDLDPAVTILEVLAQIEKDDTFSDMRIRLSSFEPGEFSDELIDFFSDSKIICPHVHIPLQSGDPGILKKMRRPYALSLYSDLTEKLFSAVPGLNLGIDVIAGFPGETDEQFNNTLEFLKKIPAAYLHVFPYSQREGTPAAEFDGQLPEAVKKDRANILRALSDEKKETFYETFIGQTLPVLVEGKRDKRTGALRGFTRNYIPILFNGDDDLIGKEVLVNLHSVQQDLVMGERADGRA